MKGCFLLQRNFAYIGQYLAQTLQKKYGVEEFCGYVSLRRSYDFLKNQKDIQYSALLLDEEIHKEYTEAVLDLPFLKTLEMEYGIPTLWRFIAVDRTVMHNQLVREYPYDTPPYTHEEILKITQVKAKKILEFIETEKPDFLFASVVGSIGSLLLFHIAKKKGIQTLVVHPTLIKDTYTLSETYNSFTYVDALFDKEKNTPQISQESYARARAFLETFRKNAHPHWELGDPKRQPVTRAQQLSFLKPSNLYRILRWMFVSIKDHVTHEDRHDFNYIGPWNYIRDGVRRKLRNIRGVSDLYDTFEPKEDCVFFPLHYEPEISLSLYAPFVPDQISAVKQVARALPVGYVLYVKEHPAMVPYRPRRFYQELKKIPNVRLIDPRITSFEILPHAKLITTITGSTGWEATLFGKPVITFGDIFYNKLSFVKNCETPKDLPWLVKEQLEVFRYNEEELISYIAALFEESATTRLQYLWEIETDEEKRRKGLEPLAALIAKKVHAVRN